MSLLSHQLSVSNVIKSGTITKSDLINSLDLINKCRMAKNERDILRVIEQLQRITYACKIISARCALTPTSDEAHVAPACNEQCNGPHLCDTCSDVTKQDALVSTEDDVFMFDVAGDRFSAYHVMKSTNHIMCLTGRTSDGELKFEHRLLMTYLMPHLHDIYVRLAGSLPTSPAASARQKALLQALTCREHEVLRWLVVGKSNWEISVIVGISERTVKYHLNKLFQKLSVSNRAQAVFKAYSLGVVNEALMDKSNNPPALHGRQ